jgi:hypothetical protein
MQLTRFDRWLREKFVHEIHIYSLRPPETMPPGTRAEDLPDEPGRRFRHRYILRSSRDADALIASFNEHNQMFATRIVDRDTWFVRFLAPEDKSVTWWLTWVVLTAVGVVGLSRVALNLWHNETFRENLRGAIEIMKG